MFSINQAYNAFYLGTEALSVFKHHITIGGRVLSYSEKTEMLNWQNDVTQIVVLGICVDAHGEIMKNDLMCYLSELQRNTNALVSGLDRFAGSFVVLVAEKDNIIIIPDATVSIPVYVLENGTAAASHERLLAEQNSLKIDPVALRLKRSGSIDSTLPGSMSLYAGMKALYPNHVVTMHGGGIDICRAEMNKHPDGGCEKFIAYTLNITNAYAELLPLVCALTGGWDSRLTLAFLVKSKARDTLQCYTSQMKHLTAESADMVIPKKLTQMLALPYRVLEHADASPQQTSEVANIVGDYATNRAAFGIAYNSAYKGCALIQGNIGDQLGKAIIGNSLPEWMATARFLSMKTHLYDSSCKAEIQTWLDGIHDCTGISKYDLFEWEIRGRWIAQIKHEMASVQILSLNIYNCRELMLLLAGMPREYRSKKRLHTDIMIQLDRRFMQLPINADAKKIEQMLNNPVLFLAGTIASYARGAYRYKLKSIKQRQ